MERETPTRGRCQSHPDRPALGICVACAAGVCDDCRIDREDPCLCHPCAAGVDPEVPSDLIAISLLDLAMAGCWFLLGWTTFRQTHGTTMAGVSGGLGLGLLAAAAGLRRAHPVGVWLHCAFGPSIACLLAVLFLQVRWDQLFRGGWIGYLYAAQALVLLPMVGWSLYRLHSRMVLRFFASRAPLRRAAIREAPFPTFGVLNLFVWLLLLLGFFRALRWAQGG